MTTNKELSNKIASAVGIAQKEANYTDKDMADALRVASQCLKIAATKQRELQDAIEKLASLNEELTKSQKLMQKKSRAEEIVNEMVRKRLVRKNESTAKVDELCKLDDDALEMFAKTVFEVPEKVANDYVSDLTFLYNNNNIKEKDRTMSKAISSLIGG